MRRLRPPTGASPRLLLVVVTVALVLSASVLTADIVAQHVRDTAAEEATQSAESVVHAFVDTHLSAALLADPTGPAADEINTTLESLVASDNLLRIKVWRPDGTVVFSDLPALRGQTFEIEHDLEEALDGEVEREFSDGTASENEFELGLAPRFLEVYLPIRKDGTGPVIGAYEIYQDASTIEASVAATRQDVLLIAGAMAAILGIVLLAAFHGTSRRLGRQNRQLRDLTDTLRESEAQMRHQAFHDPLTGLPNRALFADRVGHSLTRRRRNRAMPAVLFLDLDDFKTVNDTMGYGSGDRLLIEIARRISDTIRPGDTACRLSGDEFAILLEEIGDVDQARDVADRILARIAEPLDLAHEVTVTASLGIAMVDDDVFDAEDVLGRADVAMYAAKGAGKARHVMFEPVMRDRAWTRLQLEAELRRAIERGELAVVYQPILDLATGRTVEMEALVRWDHPERGRLAPADFLAVAEETGLIVPMGRFVLETACREASRWLARWPGDPVDISVNLSSRQFRDPALLDMITGALAAADLPTTSLKLEITESAMLDADASDTLMRRITDRGIRLAVDDFGTGFSGLSYFQRFPLDTLKIDRSFVTGLGRDPRSSAIVNATIAFAKALGLTVTAEGIETDDQRARLTGLGADRGQGYLFAQPLDAETAFAYLVRTRSASAA
jgi:diguanylate cyclase (GGDEF)-like protein